MPSWTLSNLMSQATKRIGYRSDIDASDVSFWVNEAYIEVAQATKHAQLERVAFASISSGQSRILPPENMLELWSLSHITEAGGSEKTFRRVSMAEMDASGFFPSGKPHRYALFRDWIEIWPSPNSAYSIQIRYQSYATDMVALTDVPSVTTPWRKAILYLSEAHLHELIGNSVEAAEARGRYFGYAQSLKDDEARRQMAHEDLRVSLPMRKVRYRGSRLSFDID